MNRAFSLFFISLFLIMPTEVVADLYQEDSDLFYGSYSEDFIIRWGYQDLCHHVHDVGQHAWMTEREGVTFDPSHVKPGDIIFVRNIEQFLKEIMVNISCPFILVTAGDCVQKVHRKYLKYASDEKIIEWFAIHPCKEAHPKITPIPLGVLQQKINYKNRADLTKLFAQLRKKPKEKLLYMNFGGAVKPPIKADRRDVYNLFKDEAYCYAAPFCRAEGRLRYKPYLHELADFKFTLSPQGKAIDCYRTWEALLVGTIPIVLSSQIDPLFEDLPVLIIDKWEDITQRFLNKKYQEIRQKKYSIEKLFIDYWAQKIHIVRNTFLADEKAKP